MIGKEGRHGVWLTVLASLEHLAAATERDIEAWRLVTQEEELTHDSPMRGGSGFIDLSGPTPPSQDAAPDAHVACPMKMPDGSCQLVHDKMASCQADLAFTMAVASSHNTSIIDGVVEERRRMHWTEVEGCIFVERVWELLAECAEKNWHLDVKHVKVHHTDKEKKTMTQMQEFVMEGNEKADEFAKEGTDVDGGHMAAAKALTSTQLRSVCFFFEFAAHFHVQVEHWNDRDEKCADRTVPWHLCAEEKRRPETQLRNMQCFERKVKCARCGKRTAHM